MKPIALLDALRAFFREARGGTAVIFALGAPVLALVACGAIDLAALNSDHSAMQDAADATALAMAKQLGIATAAVVALILKRSLLRGATPPFVLELPSYKWPSPRNVLTRILERRGQPEDEDVVRGALRDEREKK